jgi:hypothetical protein
VSAPWFETLMLIRSLRPGPVIDDAVTLECHGCGRRMAVAGLQMKNKVRCKACGRIHKLTPKALTFRFTEAARKKEKDTMRFGATVVFFLSMLAMAPIASGAGELLLSTGSLALLGLSAFWIAVLIHVLCYAVGAAVGLGLSWAMLLVRKRTQDLGILGAVMTIFGGFGQLVFYFVGSQVGIPFSRTPPYHLVACGLIGTTGSLWRASVFPHR